MHDSTGSLRWLRHCIDSTTIGALVLAGLLAAPPPASGQYLGENFHGDFGVNSGSQPPPGIFVTLPYGEWHVDGIRDAAGEPFLSTQFQGFDLGIIVPTLSVVTSRKVLGANYGFMVALPFSRIRPERVTDRGGGRYGFADMYVVPVYLGWHTLRADFVGGYGFYAPTGKYEAGGLDNVGLGMWSHELQAGTTIHLDSAKKFSLATMAYLEMHGNKKDQDLRVGNLLTLEGGAAYNVPKIGGAFGIGYYLQQKVSDDAGADLPVAVLRALNLYGRNRILGAGPDVTMGVFQRGTTVGAVNVRYLWSSAARSSFEGGTLWVSFTLGMMAH